MDKFFDRLGELLHSFLGTGSAQSAYYQGNDPDLQAAWEELDDYLKTGRTRKKASFQRRYDRFRTAAGLKDDSLRRDYANLEVPFGAPFEEIKSSYKELLKRYHPDHFALDPEKQHMATQITQKINESYQKIRKSVGG